MINPQGPYVPPPSPQQIAFHEAGHLVVAWVEGFETDGMRMNANLSGSAETRPGRLAPDPEEYIRKRVHILFAGTISQHLSMTKDFKPNDKTREAVRESLEFGNGRNDWANAMELVWLLRNMKATNNDDPVAEINALLQVLMDETGDILERNMLPVRRLANGALRIFDDIKPHDMMETRDGFYLPADDVIALILGDAKPHEVSDKHIESHRLERAKLVEEMDIGEECGGGG